jgi:hypothetical protein
MVTIHLKMVRQLEVSSSTIKCRKRNPKRNPMRINKSHQNARGATSLFPFHHKARSADIMNIARTVNLKGLKKDTKNRKNKRLKSSVKSSIYLLPD